MSPKPLLGSLLIALVALEYVLFERIRPCQLVLRGRARWRRIVKLDTKLAALVSLQNVFLRGDPVQAAFQHRHVFGLTRGSAY